MRRRSATRLALLVITIGFVYAGAATARRYVEIYTSPAKRTASASIDTHLATAHIANAAVFRHAVVDAGWLPGEDVVVLASASSVTRGELHQVSYAIGYLLYPSRVSVAAWCDERATQVQCATLDAHSLESAAAGRRSRLFLVIGGEHPFPLARSTRLSHMAALVSLP
jgi:hypothetical protein